MPPENATNTNKTPARGALTAAVERDDVEAVKDLLKRGADVEDADMAGNTALMFAIDNDPEIVRLLVERGADLYKKNEEGFHTWDLFKEDNDANWQWPMLSSAIEIERILSEAPKIRRQFLEKQAKETAAEYLCKKREYVKSRAHKITIKP